MRTLITFMLLMGLATGSLFAATLVEMKTSHGTIQIELYPEKAPETVENFLGYVDRGFYDGTIFHRVIRGFMIQGGGFDKHDRRKETTVPIVNQADNGLKNRPGSLAMARTNQVDSATSQFFINLTDNDFLNHRGKSPNTFGYAVFGQVIGGMDVVETIAKQRTYRRNNLFQDYPEEQIVIESIRRIDTL